MKSAEYPFILVVPLLLVKGAYSFAYRLLKRSSYLGDFKNATRKRKAGSADFSFLKRQGAVGELLYLETRLIWLNKRPRAFLTFGLLFLFYGFFVYGNPKLVHNYFYLIGMGVFLTGMFIFQYGQLIFEWESSYFDRLFTLNISIDMLFQEKYYLLSFSSLMLFIITLPFALFNYEIAFINLAALLFNAGFNVFLILFLGRYNKKRITLSKSALMNYEGTNFIHFIIFIPTVGLPYLLFIPFYFLDVPRVGIAVIAAVGFIGLLLKEQILKLLSRQYTKIKYEVLSGFRQG
ncbi:MAG TPA: hypothetical protein ENI76_04535 [Ignavibacteria bacterium]|nr:hypothetical protein [Ignavibacteria bacterium]